MVLGKWRRLMAGLAAAGLLLAAGPAGPVRAAGAPTLEFAPGKTTVTGVIALRAGVPAGVERYAITAQQGHPGDYPGRQSLATVTVRREPDDLELTHQWETERFADGYWTLRLMVRYRGQDRDEVAAERTVLVDNRPGAVPTEPGQATGTIRVTPRATGTVAVAVAVDPGAVQWSLAIQPAAARGTRDWTLLTTSGLPRDTYHWYTRDAAPGEYTLRLEVRDGHGHRWSRYATVVVDNRPDLPQTEPGTAWGTFTVAAAVTDEVRIPVTFTGQVSRWRLLYRTAGTRELSIAQGQGQAPAQAVWNTRLLPDGSYKLVLEVEDQNRHIWPLVRSVEVANRAEAAEPGPERKLIHLGLPGATLTGMIGADLTFAAGVAEWRLTAQLGRPGDYPEERVLARGGGAETGRQTAHFDSSGLQDGTWTLRAQRRLRTAAGTQWHTDDARTVTVDNRPGVAPTQPGRAGGTIRVAPQATGTVAVTVAVDPGAVEWVLSKQGARDAATNRWTRLHASSLKQDTFHWYTRRDADGTYTLRLEVRDANRHVRYVDATVTVDNRAGAPQTEPGRATAELDIPPVISGELAIALRFTGTVSTWRLRHTDPDNPGARGGSIAAGQGPAPVTVPWDTERGRDGAYLLVLEVEDEHRHITERTALTTVANKVTDTVRQGISPGEEHRFPVTTAGGLTSFRLAGKPAGYYRLALTDPDGLLLGQQWAGPAAPPLQVDLPAGTFTLSVTALFTLPGSEYAVAMKGATAHALPPARITGHLPLAARQRVSVAAQAAPESPRPAAAAWSLDGGRPTAITAPDAAVEIDTAALAEGLHRLTIRAENAVGFTTYTRVPFVVDNRDSFLDLPPAHPARWAAELLRDQQVLSGYPDGTFRPDEPVTRAEVAKLLAAAAHLDTGVPFAGAFGDVQAGDWFAPHVEALHRAGLARGYADPNGGAPAFRPGALVSRAELLVLLLRAAGPPSLLAPAPGQSLPHRDWRTVPEWARPSMYLGMKLELLAERDGGLLAADQPATRVEVAAALARLLLHGHIRPAAE